MSDTLRELSANVSPRGLQLPSPEAGVRRGQGASGDSDGQTERSGPRPWDLPAWVAFRRQSAMLGDEGRDPPRSQTLSSEVCSSSSGVLKVGNRTKERQARFLPHGIDFLMSEDILHIFHFLQNVLMCLSICLLGNSLKCDWVKSTSEGPITWYPFTLFCSFLPRSSFRWCICGRALLVCFSSPAKFQSSECHLQTFE